MTVPDKIEFLMGTLSRGSARVSSGSHPVFAGVMITAARGSVRCHVKLLDERGFFVESICAWVLRHAGISAPEPCWVWVNKSVLPRGSKWPYGELPAMLCFGTCTILLADTLRRDSSDDANARLLRWGNFPESGVFDEAFANDDRGYQNILTDGKRFWLIDNEHAFGNQYSHTENLLTNPKPHFSNTLLDLAGAQSASARLKLKELINPACGVIVKSIREAPFEELVSDEQFRNGLKFFLSHRSSTLMQDCMSRLGLGTLKQ